MKLTIYDMAQIAVLAALTFAVKTVLTLHINVELVSLLLAVYTIVLGFQHGILIAIVFTTITVFESVYYGAGDWIILYYINWPLLTVLTAVFVRDAKAEMRAAITLGLFGLLFDIPSALMKLIVFGPAYAYSYLISGIAFDAIHGGANFVIALFLFKPLCIALTKARDKLSHR